MYNNGGDNNVDSLLAALAGGRTMAAPAAAIDPYVVNAIEGRRPLLPPPASTPYASGSLSALLGALAGFEPARPPLPQSFPEGFPTLGGMPGGVTAPPTPAPSGAAPWGMLSPEEGRAEVRESLPGLQAQTEARRRQLEAAQAAEAPVTFMGMPVMTPTEAQRVSRENLEEAQKAQTTAEARLTGEAPLPTATETRHLLETGTQSAVESLADVPKFAGYIGGWIGSEAGVDVDPTNNMVFRLGKDVSDWSKGAFPGDPARQDEIGTDVAHLAGFLATLYGAGGVRAMTKGGPALIEKLGSAVSSGSQAALAASTGGMGQFEGATQAMAQREPSAASPIPGVTFMGGGGAPAGGGAGEVITERDRALATLLGAGIGLTGLIPMASALATPVEREAGAVMARALQGSGVGAAQMTAFNVLNNAVARGIYDPGRSPFEGLGRDVFLGGLMGGAAHGVSAAVGGQRRPSTPQEIDAFINQARSFDPEAQARASYWDAMRQWADDRFPRLEPPSFGEARAQEVRRKPDQQPAAPPPLETRGEEGNAPRTPPEGETAREAGGVGPGEGPLVRPGGAPGAERAPFALRRVVGTETFPLQDRAGNGLVGVVTNLKPSSQYKAGLRFAVYPEGTSIARSESPKKLGEPMAFVNMRQHPDGTWDVGIMETQPEHERRGIMSNLLDAVEQRVGQKLGGSGLFWEPGYNLWKKRDPEAVQHHQYFEGEGYVSPAYINREIERNKRDIADLDPVKDWEHVSYLQQENKQLQALLDAVPPEGKTPEKLASPLALRGFYRPDMRAVERAPQAKGTSGQWLALLNKTPGAKRWLDLMGFEDWAKEQKGSLTRENVLDFMRSHDVQLEERMLGGDPASLESGRWEPTEYASAKIAGGENYREILIRHPEIKKTYTSPHFKDYELIHLRVDDRLTDDGEKILFLNELQSDLHQKGRRQGYRPDIETAMAEGMKLYEKERPEWEARRDNVRKLYDEYNASLQEAIDEIERGTTIPNSLSELGYAQEQFPQIMEWLLLMGGNARQQPFARLYEEARRITPYDRIRKLSEKRAKVVEAQNDPRYVAEPTPPSRRDVQEEIEKLPPEAPFKGSWWSEVGVKQLIQKAVAEGYDAVAFPNSEQIEPVVGAQKGSLSAFYDKNLPKFVGKYVKGLGGKLEETNIGLSAPRSLKRTVGDALNSLRGSPDAYGLTDRELGSVNDAIRYFGQTTAQEILDDLPPRVRGIVRQKAEELKAPRLNKIVRITDAMREKILGEGQPLALRAEVGPQEQLRASIERRERMLKGAEAALSKGRSVTMPPETVAAAQDAIAGLRRVVPGDTGVHVLSAIEPKEEGGKRLLSSVFLNADGETFRVWADSLSDLSDLRGFVLNDGADILVASSFSPQRAPAGGAEVRAPDPHGSVFLHEAVHSLRRRGLFPADDWSRLVSHAVNSLQVLDMPMHEYLATLGEEVKPGGDSIRDNYEIAYASYPKAEAEALLNEEEPVAHMMELYLNGRYSKEQMEPVADLMEKLLNGAYAASSPSQPSPQPRSFNNGQEGLDEIKDDLALKIEDLIDEEFSHLSQEDWEDHGWRALETGELGEADPDLLRRVQERFPKEASAFRKMKGRE